MQTLYLIRHTAPDIAPGICYGQLDIGVAGSFDEEALRVLRWLPPLQLIVASPLLRTRRLAEYLAQQQRCELGFDARLMEKHFGAWEGLAWDNIARSEIDAWASDVMGYAPPGGESARQLMRRMQYFLNDMTCQQSIAIIAHGGSIRAMLALLGEQPLGDTLRWEIGYGAVICVRPACAR